MSSPKTELTPLDPSDLERTIGEHLNDEERRKRFRIFFNNEYYPALIPVLHQMVILPKAVDGLIERGALDEIDRKIIEVTEKLMPEWFTH